MAAVLILGSRRIVLPKTGGPLQIDVGLEEFDDEELHETGGSLKPLYFPSVATLTRLFRRGVKALRLTIKHV